MPARRPFLVACSGGPDSVALAVGMADVTLTASRSVELIHINHRLRGRASEADERFVRDLGRRLNVPVTVLSRPIRPAPGNTEERAREARYAAFASQAARVHASAILTAHTLDDQAETVIMNLLRGSSLDGLAGVQSERRDSPAAVPIFRPFLGVSRADVLGYLKARAQAYRTDASNANPTFTRNWIRHQIVPALERRCPGTRVRIGRLAELARAEREFWDRLLTTRIGRLARPWRGGFRLDARLLLRQPLAVQRRLLRRIAGFDLLTFETVENLRRWIAKPPSNARLWQLKGGWMVERLLRSPSNASSTVFWFRKIDTARNFRRKKDVSQS